MVLPSSCHHVDEQIGVALPHVSQHIPESHVDQRGLQLLWAHGWLLLKQQGSCSSSQRRGHGSATHESHAGVIAVACAWDTGAWSVDVVTSAPIAEAGSLVRWVRRADSDGVGDKRVGLAAGVGVVVACRKTYAFIPNNDADSC